MTRIERLLGALAGEEIVREVDLVVTDDWTTPALLEPLEALGTRALAVPAVLVHDHTRRPEAYQGAERALVEQRRRERDAFTRRFGVDVIEGEGIQHHVLEQEGRLRPGMLVLGNDSHTPTLGAYGVLAFAAQPTTIAAALHTGSLPLRVPETLMVRLEGRLRPGVSARDAALSLLGSLRAGGAVPRLAAGRALEFRGPGIATLTSEELAVLANVAPEALAVTATFEIDSTDVRRAPGELVLDLARVGPVLARSPHAADVVALEEFERRRVDRVFVGTCAGGTIAEIVAFTQALFEGDPSAVVAVPTIVAPVNRVVSSRMEEAGISARLEAAGVTLLPPGCGPCFGFGEGRLAAGEVAVATAPRNGVGRMGAATAEVHLVAGRAAGEAARTGYVGGRPHARLGSAAESLVGASPGERSRASARASAPERATVTWPRSGNVVRLHGLVTTDDLTPSSVPGIGTSSDRDAAVLRALLLHHVDATAADRDLRGCVVVADHGFGAGSNRASSVRALLSAGVRAVVARSVAPLYASGARDEGLPVLVHDDDAFYAALDEDSRVSVDLDAGVLEVGGRRFEVTVPTPLELAVMGAGGVVAFLAGGGRW